MNNRGRPAPTADELLEVASGTGRYEWRAAEDRLVWSEGLLRIYGLAEAPSGEAGFSNLVHPEDRVRVEAETSHFLSSDARTYSHTFHIVRSDGAIRFILDRGTVERDDRGRVLVLRGVNIDLTDMSPPGRQIMNEGAIQRLAELEALYADAPLGLAMLDEDLRFVRINEALAEINGYPVEEHVGRTAWDLLPDLRESAEPALRRVIETGLPLRDVAIRGKTPARPGIVREWREHFYPLRASDGAVRGIGIVCLEVTESVAATRALAESEERFRTMADGLPVMVWVTEPDGSCSYLNKLWYEFTGQSADDALEFGWLRAVHPDDAAPSERLFRAANASHEGFQIEYRLRRADGEYRWAIDSARPRLGPDGEFLGFIGSVIDITERKANEDGLRAARDTFRRLVDRSPFGIYAVDADFRLAQVSDGAQKVFENVRPLIGRDVVEVLRIIWPEPFATDTIARFRDTLATGEPYHAPTTVERRADIAATESYDWKIERITMPDGRLGVVCHFYDLSERQAHEEKVQHLMREMNHRAKNMLALVDAVARQTVSTSPKDFLDRFGQRIRALAASQDLLVQTDRDSADLAALIKSQLLHFADLVGGRIILDGPAVELAPVAVQTLGMAIHELATNAAKYGALSSAIGCIVISWRIGGPPDGENFSMSWTEEKGPRVTPPTRTGFGSRVAKTMVAKALKAKVETDFPETGFVWTLRCPLLEIAITTQDKKP